MTVIQLRRGTAGQWSAANPVLSQGEVGFEYDTGNFKIGDGITPWNTLPYQGSDGSSGPRLAPFKLSTDFAQGWSGGIDIVGDVTSPDNGVPGFGGGTAVYPPCTFTSLSEVIAIGDADLAVVTGLSVSSSTDCVLRIDMTAWNPSASQAIAVTVFGSVSPPATDLFIDWGTVIVTQIAGSDLQWNGSPQYFISTSGGGVYAGAVSIVISPDD